MTGQAMWALMSLLAFVAVAVLLAIGEYLAEDMSCGHCDPLCPWCPEPRGF